MDPFDESPETEEEDFPSTIDLGALLGGGGPGDEPEEEKLATDSLDALRAEEIEADEVVIDPARAAVIEATGVEDDDDVDDLEELERDGFGREREFGFDSIDEEDEDEDFDEDYD